MENGIIYYILRINERRGGKRRRIIDTQKMYAQIFQQYEQRNVTYPTLSQHTFQVISLLNLHHVSWSMYSRPLLLGIWCLVPVFVQLWSMPFSLLGQCLLVRSEQKVSYQICQFLFLVKSEWEIGPIHKNIPYYSWSSS